MGIRDRLKALALPPGATTVTEQQAAAMTPQSGQRAEPLPRDPNLASLPFPAGMPLIPALINERRDDGRADPRRSEFPTAWNLQIQEQRAVPFRVLRDVADQADIVRKCIEVVKAAIAGMPWDISIAEDAISRTMSEESVGSTEAAKLVRERYKQDITRAKDFWKSPDRINGVSFQEWVGMMLEEVLVLDALSIFPNRTADNKKLHSLEILDGATIKPLLDSRGARPAPPNPAFQQILWGFPRAEFTASPNPDGEFTADDLFYAPRTRRPFTPYGLSPVERSLPLVDLYMKRLQWFRTEFTDGVMPDLMMKSDIDFGNNPHLIAGYEAVFNDALAGNLEQRRRMRLLPNGFDPIIPKISDAKYASDFDDFLIKSITGHFGVLPSQIGFTPKHGLGGAGHQEGEAANAETLGLLPILAWVTDTLNQLSIKFLKMPPDLTFVFSTGRDDDMTRVAQRRQLEIYSGQKTWNEIRTEMGLPLYTFPEADAPLLIQSGTITPLSASFESFAVNAIGQDNDSPDPAVAQTISDLRGQKPTSNDPGVAGDVSGAAVKAELAAVENFAKARRNREFTFMHLDSETASLLNDLVKMDPGTARQTALKLKNEGDGSPKVRTGREPLPLNHPARRPSDKLVAIYTNRFRSVGNVNPDELARQFIESGATDGPSWVAASGIHLLDLDKATGILIDLYAEAGWMGHSAGRAITGRVRKKSVRWNVDWQGWSPGNPDAAAQLWGETGMGTGLQTLLDAAGITIQSIDQTRLDLLGLVLGDGVVQGLSVQQLADEIRDLLNNPERAEMIAHTEMTRATNAAQVDVFRSDGVTTVDWETAGDDGVCDVCDDHSAGGPYPIDEAPQPPEHPWCGCVLTPVEFGNDPMIDGYGEFDDEEAAEFEAPKAMKPTLVKVRRKAIDRALKRLDEIPDVKKNLIKVPWQIEGRPKVPNDDWADSLLKPYFIEQLYASQNYLKRDVLEWHLNHLGQVDDGKNSNPNVVVVDGKGIIYDGHHRLAALWLLDVDIANCWTVEV